MNEPRPIRKLLMANRAEIAMRVFQTCHNLGIGTVAVHSEADRSAPHRFGATESVEIGPAAASESYLRGDKVIDAALQTGADAIHPGYGFLSENAKFAADVEAAGITFVGPRSEHIRDMGDKVRARELMAAAGVPIVPGSDAPIGEIGELKKVAEEVGFPLLIKAAGGGGGKGIRRVDRPDELEEAFTRASSEAGSAFGDARVYIERLVSPPDTSKRRSSATVSAARSFSASVSAPSNATTRSWSKSRRPPWSTTTCAAGSARRLSPE